jgi:hypothetical protein
MGLGAGLFLGDPGGAKGNEILALDGNASFPSDFCFFNFPLMFKLLLFIAGRMDPSLLTGLFFGVCSPRICFLLICILFSPSCDARYVSVSPLALVHAPETPALRFPTREEKKFLADVREDVVLTMEGVGVVL